VALDHNGREIWQRTFGGVHCQHGAGGSPIVFDDIVVFTHEHEDSSKSKTPSNRGDAQSAWIAVDRNTGRTRWKLDRKTSPKTSYSTPCVYSSQTDKRQLIFTSLAHGMTGVDPGTGTVVWELNTAFISRVVSSPVIAGELLIGTCGDFSSGKRLIAIQPSATDKSIQSTKVYKIDDSSMPYVPTSLAKAGLLFTFHDRGYVSCLRSATGEQLWREKPAGTFFGSPVWVNGKLYCITPPPTSCCQSILSAKRATPLLPLRAGECTFAPIRTLSPSEQRKSRSPLSFRPKPPCFCTCACITPVLAFAVHKMPFGRKHKGAGKKAHGGEAACPEHSRMGGIFFNSFAECESKS
jgi:outer membrane protein assembly factor BamB